MKILNQTHYETKTLRTLLCAVHRHIAEHEGKLRQWGWLKVQVEYTRQERGVSGCAWRQGMILRLLRHQNTTAGQFVWLAYHELMHCYGYGHRQFGNIPDAEIVLVCDRYAGGLTHDALLPHKAAKPPRPKPDAQLIRYQRVLAREAAWTTRHKRAQTALKKLRQQKKYYERTLLAAGKIPREESERDDR